MRGMVVNTPVSPYNRPGLDTVDSDVSRHLQAPPRTHQRIDWLPACTSRDSLQASDTDVHPPIGRHSAPPDRRLRRLPAPRLWSTDPHLLLAPPSASKIRTTLTPTDPSVTTPLHLQADRRIHSHLLASPIQIRTSKWPVASPSCIAQHVPPVELHLQVASCPFLHLPAPASPSHSNNMLTYTEYYQSTPSPLGVGPARDLAYQTIYDYFAEETATPILLGRLLDLFEPEPVGALGIFLTDTFGKARLRLVHGLRKYPGPLTAPSTNKGKAFGYLDDIEGDAGELVLVDAALLEQAPETLVLSLDRHLDVLKHAHHSHMIPMVLGDDPHMEVITPFKACLIPFQLVPYPKHG
eukprot:jgi/Psemu1/42325/gm1.42325_g